MSSPVPLSVWSPIIPGKRTSGPFEDRITPIPRNGNKPIHVRNFADDLSTYVFPATCIYAVQNFENSRPLDRGNNNRGKRTQAESAVVQSTLKHQTSTIPGGRMGGEREREKKKKNTDRHHLPATRIYMYSLLSPVLIPRTSCLRWCNGNRRCTGGTLIDPRNLISRRILDSV